MMPGTTPDERDDFLAKVLPVVEELANERGLPFKSRLLNLTIGIVPKSKAERAFAEEALRRIWRAYPNALYPKMCLPPPAPPSLTLVQDNRATPVKTRKARPLVQHKDMGGYTKVSLRPGVTLDDVLAATGVPARP